MAVGADFEGAWREFEKIKEYGLARCAILSFVSQNIFKMHPEVLVLAIIIWSSYRPL